MHGQKPNVDRALNAAQRIRDQNYTCLHFFEDCIAAFPELALYISCPEGGSCADGSPSPATSAGRTSEDEYQRTLGALFAVYWLLRLSTDGAQSFCFGVDDEWYPLSEHSTTPPRPPEELRKRQAFLEQTKWEEFDQLFVDAGLLWKTGSVSPTGTPTPSRRCAGDMSHDIDRTLALLVLTAIHDIMKVSALCPTVAEGCGPWCGYQVGEKIHDHDAALGYVLQNLPDALPSFAMLPRAQRRTLKFTQCKMDYNMGWLVQAEAPPGALFGKFKKVMESGEATAADVAFYFVHWITDLAGAEPCPQEGCEKFVLNFPQRVLASFLSSFSIVQHLSSMTETQVFEEYLLWRWQTCEGNGLGPAPNGQGSIARLRLVIMAQGSTQQVLNAFRLLPAEDAAVLEEELMRTGCEGQVFQREGRSPSNAGPALLVYYAPALMQKAGKADPLGAMTVLADIFRQARSLFPLSPERAGETAIIRIDMLKDLEVKSVRQQATPGEVWVLQKVSSKDAQVRRVNLVAHHKEGVSWSTSRALFAGVPRSSRAGPFKNKVSSAWFYTEATSAPKPMVSVRRQRDSSSASPSPAHQRGMESSFWHRTATIQTAVEPPVVAVTRTGARTRASSDKR